MSTENETPENVSIYGHIKSFVHRKGHFSEGQRRAYETLLPIYGVVYEPQLKTAADWAQIFARPALE